MNSANGERKDEGRRKKEKMREEERKRERQRSGKISAPTLKTQSTQKKKNFFF